MDWALARCWFFIQWPTSSHENCTSMVSKRLWCAMNVRLWRWPRHENLPIESSLSNRWEDMCPWKGKLSKTRQRWESDRSVPWELRRRGEGDLWAGNCTFQKLDLNWALKDDWLPQVKRTGQCTGKAGRALVRRTVDDKELEWVSWTS